LYAPRHTPQNSSIERLQNLKSFIGEIDWHNEPTSDGISGHPDLFILENPH